MRSRKSSKSFIKGGDDDPPSPTIPPPPGLILSCLPAERGRIIQGGDGTSSPTGPGPLPYVDLIERTFDKNATQL
jgi:hypothetical protein